MGFFIVDGPSQEEILSKVGENMITLTLMVKRNPLVETVSSYILQMKTQDLLGFGCVGGFRLKGIGCGHGYYHAGDRRGYFTEV